MLLLLLPASLNYNRGLQVFIVEPHPLDLHREFEVLARYHIDRLYQCLFLGILLFQQSLK